MLERFYKTLITVNSPVITKVRAPSLRVLTAEQVLLNSSQKALSAVRTMTARDGELLLSPEPGGRA